MRTNNLIKSYKTKNGEIRYMFSIYLGLDLSTNTVKRTTHRGFKSLIEAELTYNQLSAYETIKVNG